MHQRVAGLFGFHRKSCLLAGVKVSGVLRGGYMIEMYKHSIRRIGEDLAAIYFRGGQPVSQDDLIPVKPLGLRRSEQDGIRREQKKGSGKERYGKPGFCSPDNLFFYEKGNGCHCNLHQRKDPRARFSREKCNQA